MATVTITDGGLDLYALAARSFIDARVKYVAVGTDNTSPSSSDTTLGAEVFRKALTAGDDGVSTGESIFTLYLSPQDAVGVAIAEVGWFGGDDATATADTGTLIGRGLYSHSKTDKESIGVVFTESFA
jgi:hypothetical protein